MSKLLIIVLFSSLLFAKEHYYVSYKNITLGKIQDMATLKDGYIVAIPTNSWLKFILNFDKYIVYERNKKPVISGKTEFTRDKYFIIKLINELKIIRPNKQVFTQKDQTLSLQCNNNNCTYTRISTKNDDVYDGYINFTSNNELKVICDSESSICIEKK